jgi:hypothetical protein
MARISLLRSSQKTKLFSAPRTLARFGNAHRQGELVGVPIAGDDPHALDIASSLIREIGFDPVIIGGLAMGKYLVPGTPPLGGEHTAAEVRQIIANLH